MKPTILFFYLISLIQEVKLLELSPDPLAVLFWHGDAPFFLRHKNLLDKRTLEVIFFLVFDKLRMQTGLTLSI
jgi:hypothetical protein